MGLREQSAEIIFNIWKKKRKPQWDDVDWSALTDQHKEAFYEVADQILKLFEPEKCPNCDNGKVWHITDGNSMWSESCPTCHGTGNKQPVRPKIVCLCGSGRFRQAFEEAEFNETLEGNIVLTIGCNTKDIDLSQFKQMLDELHKRKIDLADEVFVLNVGGYIGESTRSEIEYATKLGKPIKYLEAIK